MNDRYLFRGKRADNGEWVIGNLLIIDNEEYRIVTSCLQGDDKNLLDNVCAYKVVPETVGQCTGLKDKNGKLIFEGDVLRVITDNDWFWPKGTKVYYEVVFTEFNEECATWAEYIGFMAKRDEDNLNSIHYIVNSYGAKVIGNIHDDNPELLEVEE